MHADTRGALLGDTAAQMHRCIQREVIHLSSHELSEIGGDAEATMHWKLG